MKQTKFFRKILIVVLALLMFVGVGMEIMLPALGGKSKASAANVEIKMQLTALELINDTNVAIDSWSFGEKNIPGNKSTYQYTRMEGSEYVGTNKSFSSVAFTEFFFKKDPANIAENKEGSTVKWYWDNQNSASPQGPYKIKTTLYVLSVNGKLYLPYAAIKTDMPFFIGSDLYPVTEGQTVTVTDLYRNHGGNPTKTPTSLFLPIDETDWLKWDSQGRAYFTPGNPALGTCYVTVDQNGKPSTTKNADEATPLPQTKSVPSDAETKLKEYETQSPAKLFTTYSGEGMKTCPVEENTEYWTVNVTKPSNGTAGNYSATVTPKDGYTWSDGSTEPKTIYWSIGKGEQSLSLDYSESNALEIQDEKTDVPFKIGSEQLVNKGAEITYTVEPIEGESFPNGEEPIELTKKDDPFGFTVTRKTKNRVSAKVTVTVAGNDDLEAKTFTFNVNLEAGAGFYVEGTPDVIYDTLADAIKAAEAVGSSGAPTIHVNGKVEMGSAVDLPTNLTLVGDEGSEIVVTGDQPIFDVKSGNNLTLKGVSLKGNGSAIVKVSGGTLEAMAAGADESIPTVFTNGGIEVAGGEVELNTVTFTGDGLDVAGGAVNFNGDVTFDSCRAEDGNGGALNITGGEVTLNGGNVEMKECTASGKGGAVYVSGGKFDASQGSLAITASAAEGKGGAIYVASNEETNVTLGESLTVSNNKAEDSGNGVYIEDGASLTLSTEGAVGITDGIMLGHDDTAADKNASITLNGEAPEGGKTIVVEFENPAAQLEDSGAQYVKSEELDSNALKGFMRVKNAGYTFDPSAGGNTLGLTTSDSMVAMVVIGGQERQFASINEAIQEVANSENKDATVYLLQVYNKTTPEEPQPIELDDTITIPEGVAITFASAVRVADDAGDVTFYYPESESGNTFENLKTNVSEYTYPTTATLVRGSSLTDEMIKVAEGGSLTLGNVTLDGGAKWDKETPNGGGSWDDVFTENSTVKIKDDGKGSAGTVETNNSGVTAHAPVIVNAGTLNIEDGATIQNNDNNYATPGKGFGSENYGGGVRNQGKGQLTMTGGTIKDCYSREGGAIMNVNKPGTDGYVDPTDGNPTVTVSGGTISGNVSQTKGAAIQNVYGGATTEVKNGENQQSATITDNVSLRDLGVLTVEEGASLTVSGGTVSATESKNALYLYNQYSAENYANAQSNAKPYIEGNGAGELTVSGSPTITGNVHVDGSCYVVDVENSTEGNYQPSTQFYDTYVDLKEYSGTNLKVTADKVGESETMVDGKIAKLPEGATLDDWKTKLGITPDEKNGGLKDSFTFVYTDGSGTWLAQGSYELTVSQSEPNKLTVSGKVDKDCTSVKVQIGTTTVTLTPKDGVISDTIDLAEYAATAQNGDIQATVTLDYGTSTSVIEENNVGFKALLKNADGKFVYPTDAKYQTTNEEFAAAPTDGTVPDNAKIDENGYATFKWGNPEEEVRIKVGAREEAPDFGSESAATLTELSDNSVTFTVGEKYRNLEFALVDGQGIPLWQKPVDGVLTFSDLTAETKYTLKARTPAGTDGENATLPSLPTDVNSFYTLSEAQQTAKEAFENAFNNLFTKDSDGWQLTDDSTDIETLESALDTYSALLTAMAPQDTSDDAQLATESAVLSIEQERYNVLKAAHEQKLAKEWFDTYAESLKQAMEYAQGNNDLFSDVEMPTDEDVEALKAKLVEADKAFNDLPDGAKVAAVELLATNQEDGKEVPLNDAFTAYLNVAVKQMQGEVEGLDDELQDFGNTFVTALEAAESIDAAKEIEEKFKAAKEAADEVKKKYDEAYGDTDLNEYGKKYLDEKLSELYSEIADEGAKDTPDYQNIIDKAGDVFGLAGTVGQAQETFMAAVDEIFGEDTSEEVDKAIESGLAEIGNAATKEEVGDALKEAVQALLVGTGEGDEQNLSGSAMRKGDSKDVKEYLAGVAEAVKDATAGTGELPDVLSAVSGVSSALAEMRQSERDVAVGEYQAVYKLLTGEDASSVPETLQNAADCSELNKALQAAVEALLDGMKEGASDDLLTHIESLLDEVEETVTDAKESGEVADLSAALKVLEEARLSEAKQAAEKAYKDYYEAITGEECPEDDPAFAAFQEAVEGVTLEDSDEDSNIVSALAKLDDLLTDAMETLLDGQAEDDLPLVTEYIEGVKGQMSDEPVDDYSGLHNYGELFADVQEGLAHARAVENAKKAYKDYYEAITGEECPEDAPALGDITGDDITELNDALKEAVQELLDGQVREGDSKEVKELVEAQKEAIAEAVEEASKSGTAADLADAIEDAKKAIDDQRAEEIENAKDAYKDYYEAITGEECPEDAPALGDITGEDISELNDALKEAVQELLDGQVREGDSKEVKDLVEAQKEAIAEAVEEASKSGSAADLTDAIEDAKQAIDDQRAEEIENAKEAYKEYYEAITGEECPEDAPALGDITGEDISELNEALKEAVQELLDGQVREGDSQALKDLVEAQKEAIAEAVKEASKNGTAADLTDAIEEAKKAIDDQRKQEVENAKDAYKEYYEAITGEECPDDAPALDDITGEDISELNDALKEAVQELLDGQVRDGDSQALKELVEAQKEAIAEAVEAASKSGTAADLTDTIEEAKKAIEDQRKQEVENAKDAYKEYYEAITGEECPEDAPALGDITGDDISELNEALKEAVQELLDGQVREGDSKEVKELVEAQKEAIAEAVEEANKNGAAADLAEAIEEAKKAIEDKRAEEVQNAKEAYKEYYEAITGEECPEDAPALDDITGEDISELNDALKEAVQELLDGQVRDGDSQALKELVEAQKEAIAEAVEAASKSGTAADLTDTIEEAKQAIEGKRAEELENAKQALVEAYNTINGTQYTGEEELPQELAAALAALGGASDCGELNGVIATQVGNFLDAHTAEDSAEVKALAEDAKAAISKEADTSEQIADVTQTLGEHLDLIKEQRAKEAAEGDSFLDDNEVLKKDFDALTPADAEALREALEELGTIGEGAKKHLDEQSPYTSFEEEIEDKLNKIEFEQKKEELLEEADKLLREHDGEYVKDVFEAQRSAIEEKEYEAHLDDATRDSYRKERQSALEDALRQAKEQTSLAQNVQRAVNRARAAADELLGSGRYNDRQAKMFDDLISDLEERAKKVPAGGENGKTAAEMLESLLGETLDSFDQIPVAATTAGDIKADKSPATEGGTGDYGEKHDGALWGILENDEGMPSGGQLSIEAKEGGDLSAIERAAEEGKLTAAKGSDFGETPVKSLIADKRVAATFDVSLLIGEGTFTQFNGMYTVRILLPAGMRGEKDFLVVHEENGAAEVFKTTVEDGKYLVFTADRLTSFTVLCEDTLNLWWLIVSLAVILAAELVVLAVLLFGKNRREKAASVLPIGLLAVIIPNGAAVICIVLAVCVVAAGIGVVLALLGKKKKTASDAESRKESNDRV